MRDSTRATRAGAGILLASASIAAVSGVLVAATPPLDASPAVLLPLSAAAIGVVVTGHLLHRAALGWVLVVWMLIGSFVGFATTSGVVPPGVVLAISLFVTIAVYPFDRSTTRLLLMVCAIGVGCALVGGALRPLDHTIARGLAVIAGAVAVVTYAAGAIVVVRRGREPSANGPGGSEW